MVYVWETSNLPRLPYLTRWVIHTLNTHKHAQTHRSLKGTFAIAPSFTRLTMGDQLSTAVSLYWKEESLFFNIFIFTESRQYVFDWRLAFLEFNSK